MPKRVVIDTDPGVDDALALILALQSPELKVEAITTVSGNVPVEQATKNVLRVLNLLNPKPRPLVAKGAARPLRKPPITATAVFGADGLGELDRFKNPDGSPRYPEPEVPQDLPMAHKAILELLDRYPGELTLITLGPLTNLAQALLENREGVKTLREVVIMGGAIGVPGNITPAAEFNIHVDPHAAQIVFASGLPITLVPLDVTERVTLSRDAIETPAQSLNDPLPQFISDATAKVMGFMERVYGVPVITLHDPLAVGVAIDPSFVKTSPLHVDVETDGRITEGMTVADLRSIREDLKEPPNLHGALEVDADRFLAFFLERVCQRNVTLSVSEGSS